MRVVIDTNVVVSAVLKNRVPEEIILFVVENPDFEWVASTKIVTEYITVLQRPKFNLPRSILWKWQRIFEQIITIVEVQENIDFERDPKDAMFLSCALKSGAEYFITGDKDFTEAYKIVNTIVLSVSQFKRLVCDKW